MKDSGDKSQERPRNDQAATPNRAHRPSPGARRSDPSPDHTVFAPPKAKGSSAASQAPPAKHPEVQLTRIRKAIREQDSSRGFQVAKEAADSALAADQIVLNKRFVLEATLGAGGMGTVYRAKDLRKVEADDPQPYVAVKVLNEDFKDHPQAFVALQREASRSHSLSHPNIVTVHDFDRDGEVFYMTMELLEGQGLEALLRKHRPKGLPKTQALAILGDICRALSYAHKKHIVHSDLKPGNIFVCANGTKVLDFGIARFTQQSLQCGFDAGSLGALTPAYASAEMFAGEAPHPSDDVYALGVIAYELFAGTHPYDREPANLALAKKRRPKPIKGLSKSEWKALEQALRLRRSERTQDVASFYNGLVRKRSRQGWALAASLLVGGLGAAAAFVFMGQGKLQRAIAETYRDGQACLEQEQFNCAIDSARAVLELDESHAQAQALLKAAEKAQSQQQLAQVQGEFETCLASADTACARNSLDEFRRLAGSTLSVSELEQKLVGLEIEQQQQAELARAEQCLTELNYACAVEAARNALALGEQPAAQQALTEALTAQARQAERAVALKSEFKTLVQKAQSCLEQTRFDCASEHAQKARSLAVDKGAAESLMRRIDFIRVQHQANLDKARRVLDKGGECFAKKNYSCAIANADSALEFVPGFEPALALKQRAEQEITRIKSQIILQ